MHKIIPNVFTFISNFKKEEILKLEKNVGIIFRNYEKIPEKNKILEFKRFCRFHGRKFYLANNIKLALNLDLDGVYIPSFNKSLDVKKYNKKKNFLILGSAHNISEIKVKEKQDVQLIFLSSLLKTKKNKNFLGVIKFNLLTHLTKKKIIALGGINKDNINKLKMTNTHGYSGISYFFNKR